MSNSLDVAVIGMACNFPQAKTLDEFWHLLANGKEAIRKLSEAEMTQKGVTTQMRQNPNYVNSVSGLDDIELFDAEFFGFSPNEAICLDPQQRIFLEACWTAFDNAGIDPLTCPEAIGVFAGIGMNSYVSEVIIKNPQFIQNIDGFQMLIGNDKDFVATHASYKMNLRGPSLNVNTACSSSLVSIHLARQSLLLGECDMALAGGVSVYLPNAKGYIYTKDSILSPDGHCRAFDEQASGTVWGDGCGVVLLKRLDDALADKDHIYAIVKGSAINNDGSQKAGFTAPSVQGQSRMIREALDVSGLTAEAICFVEAHGTGTALGDPIEIAGLSEAFGLAAGTAEPCPIGSVKTNIGHLNHAAGIAGFIKAVLAVYNKQLPPSLHFKRGNPQIGLEKSPFYVNTQLTALKPRTEFIYGGVSSMGIGGTNAHIVIGEAPQAANHQASGLNQPEILLLSAKNQTSLENMAQSLAAYLAANPDTALEALAYTLQCRRHHFAKRLAIVCSSPSEAEDLLRASGGNWPTNLERVANPQARQSLEKWLQGQSVDWSGFYKATKPQTLALPGYAFKRQRYWVDPSQSEAPIELRDHYQKMENMADWFYLPSWEQRTLAPKKPDLNHSTFLFFGNGTALSQDLEKTLKDSGQRLILVNQGAGYASIDSDHFTLNPENAGDFTKLFVDLAQEKLQKLEILFLWALGKEDQSVVDQGFEEIKQSQYNGFFSLLFMAQGMYRAGFQLKARLTAVTNNVFDLFGQEAVSLAASTIPGMCMVFQQEFLNVECKVVDLDWDQLNKTPAQMTGCLVAEVQDANDEIVCAYRGNTRFVRHYQAHSLQAVMPNDFTIKKDEAYLVFGSTEGIGHLVANYMKDVKGAKLILMEEASFPEEAQWADILKNYDHSHPLGERISNIQQLIASGVEYLGKISDPDLAAKIRACEERFGQIQGIMHSPGASNAKRIEGLRDVTPDSWEENFLAVGYSMITLDRLFADRQLKFKVMLNSLGSILGGAGFINVTTTGNYVKSYNKLCAAHGKSPWAIQCWDSWTEEWKLLKYTLPESFFQNVEKSIITNEQGIECYRNTAALMAYPEIIISATRLDSRYKRWVKRESVKKESIARFPRPELATAYLPAETLQDRKLEAIFTELLGIEKIGLDDDFYELGGHSLLVIQLAGRLHESFEVLLDKPTLLQNTSIRMLSTVLTDVLAK